MSIELKLDAYILPDDHRVFKCFPGRGYRFYDLVDNEHAVFLDIDGLEDLGLDARSWTDQTVIEAVRADRRRREASRAARGQFVPDRTGYSATGFSRTDRRDTTFALGLYKVAKQGDLVVVPAEGYHREVLIGELMGGPNDLRIVESANGAGDIFRYVARDVKWLARIPKHELPGRLINRLHTQTAFFDIGQNSYADIYDLAYQNYIKGLNFVATFSTSKEHFTSRDNLLASIWFEALSAIREHIEGQAGGVSLAGRSFADLAFASPVGADRGELSININSPGEFILRSVGSFAVVTMALFALAQAGVSAADAQTVHIAAHQVGAASQHCLGQIHDSVRLYIENMEDPQWLDACHIAQTAHKVSTIHTKAHVQIPSGHHT